MLSVAQSDLGDHSLNFESIFGLANELSKPQCAAYGPSLEQIAEYDITLQCWTEELKIVDSLKTVVSLVSNKIQSADPQDDSHELLKVVSALLLNRLYTGRELRNKIISDYNLAPSQKKHLKNKFSALEDKMNGLNEDILDLRHKLLHLQGVVARFRPSERNIAHAIRVSNQSLSSTEASEFELI